jgi:photosystem II stability/assembly factor-like uncharacterized protein
VHKLLLHPAAPGRLYQQNHWGTYRSDDRGETWTRFDKGLPTDFGFGIALDAHDRERCYVVPLDAQEGVFRATTGSLAVYGHDGKRWTALRRGLPAAHAYLGVQREGMASDPLRPCGLYVGTTTGQLFASADAGRSWRQIASYLPAIMSVSVAVV